MGGRRSEMKITTIVSDFLISHKMELVALLK